MRRRRQLLERAEAEAAAEQAQADDAAREQLLRSGFCSRELAAGLPDAAGAAESCAPLPVGAASTPELAGPSVAEGGAGPGEALPGPRRS